MRAREVYEKLHKSTDPKLLEVLVAIAERQSVQQQEIDALGKAHDGTVGLVEQMIRVGENMKTRLEKIRGPDDNPKPLTGVKLQG